MAARRSTSSQAANRLARSASARFLDRPDARTSPEGGMPSTTTISPPRSASACRSPHRARICLGSARWASATIRRWRRPPVWRSFGGSPKNGSAREPASWAKRLPTSSGGSSVGAVARLGGERDGWRCCAASVARDRGDGRRYRGGSPCSARRSPRRVRHDRCRFAVVFARSPIGIDHCLFAHRSAEPAHVRCLKTIDASVAGSRAVSARALMPPPPRVSPYCRRLPRGYGNVRRRPAFRTRTDASGEID